MWMSATILCLFDTNSLKIFSRKYVQRVHTNVIICNVFFSFTDFNVENKFKNYKYPQMFKCLKNLSSETGMFKNEKRNNNFRTRFPASC